MVNRLGGLSLPRKSVVRLTDRPNMTLDVYRGRKTTMPHATYFTVGHRCPSLYIKGAAVKGSHSHSQAYYKYLHPVMIEVLWRGLGYY